MSYRPTGIGAFGFSLNWEQVPGDEAIARRVITYLEDRRLLFGIRHSEDELASAKPGRSLAASLRAVRLALRGFVDAAGPNAREFRYHGGTQTDSFSLALGELRALVGFHLAVIAEQYGIEVEPDLAQILPPADPGDDDPSFIPGFDRP